MFTSIRRIAGLWSFLPWHIERLAMYQYESGLYADLESAYLEVHAMMAKAEASVQSLDGSFRFDFSSASFSQIPDPGPAPQTISRCFFLPALSPWYKDSRWYLEGLPWGLKCHGQEQLGELTRGALFFIKGGQLITTPLVPGVLASVTRRAVLQVASELGISVRRESVRLGDLADFEAVFSVNSLRGPFMITQILGRQIKGGHDVFRPIKQSYEKFETSHRYQFQTVSRLPKEHGQRLSHPAFL